MIGDCPSASEAVGVIEPGVRRRENATLHFLNALLYFGLILRLSHARRQKRAPIVLRKLLVGAVHLRLKPVCCGHARLEVVRGNQVRQSAEEVEGMDMGVNPLRQLLRRAGLGEGAITLPQHRHKYLRRSHLAGCAVHHGHGVVAVIQKQFVTRLMLLTHRQVQRAAPLAVANAKLHVAEVFLRMGFPVLLPQQLQRDDLALQFPVHLRPIRHEPSRTFLQRGREEPLLQFLIRHLLRKRP